MEHTEHTIRLAPGADVPMIRSVVEDADGDAMMRYLDDRLSSANACSSSRDDGNPGVPAHPRRLHRANDYAKEARIQEFCEPRGDKVFFW